MHKENITITIGIIIISLVILGAITIAAFSANSAKNPAPTTFNSTDQDKPSLQISEKSFDLGKMTLSETKSKEIILKNIGAKPLTLWGFTTSCDCTYAELSIGQEKSPRFSMHYKKDWQKDLSSGQEANLKISYQPSIMPVQGEVSRTVYFQTNDPENPKMTITFKAFVE